MIADELSGTMMNWYTINATAQIACKKINKLEAKYGRFYMNK